MRFSTQRKPLLYSSAWLKEIQTSLSFDFLALHRLSESTIDAARLMAQAISLDSKFDVRVSTFGTSSGILIHAEKIGNKSLNRRNN